MTRNWFKCNRCGDAKKVLVLPHVVKLSTPCACGGIYERI